MNCGRFCPQELKSIFGGSLIELVDASCRISCAQEESEEGRKMRDHLRKEQLSQVFGLSI